MKAIERDAMKHLGFSREKARELARLTGEHGPLYVPRVMELLNAMLDGHGVESILDHKHSSVWPTVAFDYVNMGDTYAPTLVYRHDLGGPRAFRVSTWGDELELYERKHGRVIDIYGV